MDDKYISNDSAYEFHYDREERLSMMPESVLQFKKKKKKNRSVLILLLDIILICLLSLGFMIYQKFTNNSYSSDNYNFTLKTYIYDENLLISITSVNKLPVNTNSKKQESIPVEFIVKLSKIDDFYKKIFDVLPQKNGSAKTYRASIPLNELPYIPDSTFVKVNVKFGNNSINLKHKLLYEK
jgi:hypothetical protein